MRGAVAIAVIVTGASCSEAPDDLLGVGPDAGGTPLADAGPVDGGPTVDPTDCDALTFDPEEDLLELHRLALALAPAVIIVRPGPIEVEGGTVFRALDLEEVRYGLPGLEGQRVWYRGSEAELSSLGSGPHVAAFGGQNAYPVEFDGRVQWQPHVLRPFDGDEALPLGYARRLATAIAAVRVAERTDQRALFRTIETLWGELPTEVSTAYFGADNRPPFPPAGDATYVASFRYVSFNEFTGEWVGTLLDVRDDTPANRAAVADALAQPSPVDAVAARAEAAEHRGAWDYGRAEHVVTTEVSGVSFDNATGAGGMVLENALLDVLAGDPSGDRLYHGGHGSYFEEQCGDAQLYALRANALFAAPPGATFACEGPAGFPPYESYEGAVIDRRPASASNDRRVRAWIAAPPPLLRLWPEDASLGVADAAPLSASPSSRPVSWPAALASAPIVGLRVAEVESRSGWQTMALEPVTGFGLTPLPFDGARVATTCPLPHLEVGSSWLVGAHVDPVFDRAEPGPRSDMLFAGPWIEATPPNARTIHVVRQAYFRGD